MSDPVPRTCTEIGEDGSPVEPERPSDKPVDWRSILAGDASGAGAEPSLALDDFRESSAYVLLGAPGAGKTTLFQAEGARAGCHYVTARDFLTFDGGCQREDVTLFIDGLDEVRAGSTDGRTLLDGIRSRLDGLGRPRFRLSCREADWFGANDRTHLAKVSRDGTVRVLRLDPLSCDGLRALLSRHPGIGDPDRFIAEARERGIDALLDNPQSLRMLADAVSGGAWPDTRMRTFDLACERLVREPNPEHRLAHREGPGASALLAAAGRLCAISLLTGHAGYALAGGEGDSDYLGLEQIPGDRREILRRVLGSRLFQSPEEGRVTPIHRQIAEFLAARYLAASLNEGLPMRRMLALITGGDGGVVSDLRGLAAWLAAHCPAARRELVERDPVGVAAYGDAGVYTPDEKGHLLERLRPLDQLPNASLFTSLATSDMAPVLREYLNEGSRDDRHQSFKVFLLCVLANAAPLPALGDVFLDLAADGDGSPRPRGWAAICLAHGALVRPERFGEAVRRLLNGLRDGRIRDDDRSILGDLLRILYPTFIKPDEVLEYLDEDHEENDYIRRTVGRYRHFWRLDLARSSRPEDAAVVLDRLADLFDGSEEWRLTGEPPHPVLARAAGALAGKALSQADDRDLRRTLRWLRVAGGDDWGDPDSSRAIRSWIEARPERYKGLLRESASASRHLESQEFNAHMRLAKESLHGAKVPSDYGRWCLEEIARAEGNEDLAGFWFEEAWNTLLHDGGANGLTLEGGIDWCPAAAFALHDNGAEGLTLERLEAVAAGDAQLARVFDGLRLTDLHGEFAAMQRRKWQRSRERRRQQDQASTNRRRFFRRYRKALRDNRCPAGPLNAIAEAYWGHHPHIQGESGRERLRELLGEDALVSAALEGLRNAIHRSDLPSPKKVLALRIAGQRHLLAFPVIAGIDLLSENALSRLDAEQVRLAIALFLASRPPSGESAWLEATVGSHPGIAAEEIVRFATMELRRGERHVSFAYEMLDYEWLAEVARAVCPKLLRSFPPRAPRHLSGVLNRLLWWGAGNLEAPMMESIVARKLGGKSMTLIQRAHWLAAHLVVSTEPDLTSVEEFADAHPSAMAGFFTFYERSSARRLLLDRLSSTSLGRLARLLGAGRRPLSAVRSRLVEFRESDLVRSLLEELGMRTGDDAVSALTDLARDPDVAAWRPTIRRVQQEQRVLCRDARYRHPDIDAVCRALENRQPANAADLAALTFDHLGELARSIRHGNTNDWRQYWNPGGADRSWESECEDDGRDAMWTSSRSRVRFSTWEPKHEVDCRDALLSDLQARLRPLGIDSAPEGRYADEKRADIRVSYCGFNVPLKIKKCSQRDLWSAVRNQLSAKYTRDPGAGGYGIYVVFWFGNEAKPCQMPESGPRPGSAAELEERLRSTLSPEEKRLISVCVVDVARP